LLNNFKTFFTVIKLIERSLVQNLTCK